MGPSAEVTRPPRVAVIGPAAWNHIIVLERLPEPRPHMQSALDSWWTVGGTSAGKALHLHDLGADVTLVTPIADDGAGALLLDALRSTGLTVVPVHSRVTESHTNLMTRGGDRVSLYTAAPQSASARDVASAADQARHAEAVVADMSPLGRATLPQLADLGVPIWTDAHDWNGVDEYHRDFVDAADVVVLNDDGGGDRDALMSDVLATGARLVIRTLGAHGAVAVDAGGSWHRVPAEHVDAMIDTNGAGDAFTAGAMLASLGGASAGDVMRAGARQALRALGTRHLSPLLD